MFCWKSPVVPEIQLFMISYIYIPLKNLHLCIWINFNAMAVRSDPTSLNGVSGEVNQRGIQQYNYLLDTLTSNVETSWSSDEEDIVLCGISLRGAESLSWISVKDFQALFWYMYVTLKNLNFTTRIANFIIRTFLKQDLHVKDFVNFIV